MLRTSGCPNQWPLLLAVVVVLLKLTVCMCWDKSQVATKLKFAPPSLPFSAPQAKGTLQLQQQQNDLRSVRTVSSNSCCNSLSLSLSLSLRLPLSCCHLSLAALCNLPDSRERQRERGSGRGEVEARQSVPYNQVATRRKRNFSSPMSPVGQEHIEQCICTDTHTRTYNKVSSQLPRPHSDTHMCNLRRYHGNYSQVR